MRDIQNQSLFIFDDELRLAHYDVMLNKLGGTLHLIHVMLRWTKFGYPY
jgi:hypothetical protein